MQTLLRALSLASVASAATCPYAALGGTSILAGDDNCGTDNWCLLRSSDCARLKYTYHATDDAFSVLGAIGNLTTYANTELTVAKSNRVDLSRMVLPPTLRALYICATSFKSVASLTAFSDLQPSSWSKLSSLSLENCSLTRLPLPLPMNVSKLRLVDNTISSLADLPAQVTLLDASSNNLRRVSNANWSAVTSVDLSSNPLRTFANVQLSSRLVYFNIEFCQIDNFVVDTPTFAALNTLGSTGNMFDGDDNLLPIGYRVSHDIDTNPAACAAVRGQILRLWPRSGYTVNVCLADAGLEWTSAYDTIANPSSSASTTKDNTGIIVGAVVGGLVTVGLLVLLVKNCRSSKTPASTPPYERGPLTPRGPTEPKRYTYQPPDVLPPEPLLSPAPEPAPSQDTRTDAAIPHKSDGASARGSTASCSEHDAPTHYDEKGSSHGPVSVTSATSEGDIYAAVAPLRDHKLDLVDLVVISEKPLASGAYGEVWLGTYANNKVAIKRLKDRSPASVFQFIDEIKLLSRIQSEYVVKFVGASWTRPIDIECVLEYMDLGDLRNYLATNSPAQFPWDQKLKSIVSIVRGLVYLHTFSPPIIHRDLKSRNVLLDSKKGTKLTDFGSSREIDESTLTNGVGTYQWMAPEIIIGTEYTVAADIYSFGVILSEFSTHNVSYSDLVNPGTGRPWNQQYIITKVTTGQLTPTLDETHTPVWVREMAAVCLQNKPEARPSSMQLSAMLQRL